MKKYTITIFGVFLLFLLLYWMVGNENENAYTSDRRIIWKNNWLANDSKIRSSRNDLRIKPLHPFFVYVDGTLNDVDRRWSLKIPTSPDLLLFEKKYCLLYCVENAFDDKWGWGKMKKTFLIVRMGDGKIVDAKATTNLVDGWFVDSKDFVVVESNKNDIDFEFVHLPADFYS